MTMTTCSSQYKNKLVSTSWEKHVMDYIENSTHGRKRKNSFFLHGLTFLYPDIRIMAKPRLDSSVGFAALNDEKMIYATDVGLHIMELETKQTVQHMHMDVIGENLMRVSMLKAILIMVKVTVIFCS